MQRTRCPYFYDIAFACNKRKPGSGCAALNGYNRSNAVLGGSDYCIATHPSDMCVALAALDAIIEIEADNGNRSVPIVDFHLLPNDSLHIETALKPGEIITEVTIPPLPFARKSFYLKVRDRASYEFALASAAVALEVQAGKIHSARVALGGIGTKPWRSREAETVLVGADNNHAAYQRVAEAALDSARPHAFNAFKIELAKPKESMKRKLQAERGDVSQAWPEAAAQIAVTYSTPVCHHNPMEPHATIAVWSGDDLPVYDSTQSVMGNLNAIAASLGVPPENVRLISLFVGGGFGCKGFTWGHSLLAPMAAREIGRPVKLVLDRQQMFTANGRRAATIQKISLGAQKGGRLLAIDHETQTETSFVGEFVETAGLSTQRLYACPNVRISHQVAQLNLGTPTAMRAPGQAPGTFALESAMDELAAALKIDPIELRLINYAETDPQTAKAWSGKNLKECYRRGAHAIGWSRRAAEPRSLREGACLVGYGMATAIYPGNRVPASAQVQLFSEGHAVAASATQDIGTGTYTIMTQITADALGLPLDQVQFKLGDSTLPKAPVSGGSQTAASVGPAVKEAALAVRNKILNLAVADRQSPLFSQPLDNITTENGRCIARNDTNKARPMLIS